jgi:phage baseplate assembly protein W
MADFNLEWRGDFSLDPTGDILTVDGDDMVRQRIERRLFTSIHAYIFHTEYGAGLPERIGRVARERDIQSLVRANIALETTVAKIPVPAIVVTQDIAGLFVIAITYTDEATGTSVSLNFEVPAN